MSNKVSTVINASVNIVEIKKIKGVSFTPAFTEKGTESKTHIRVYCKRKDFAKILNILYPETFPLTPRNEIEAAAALYVWIKYLHK